MTPFLRYLLATILVLCVFSLFSQDIQQKHHRARIYYSGNSEQETLENIGVELNHGVHKKGVYIESDFSEQELQWVRDAGFAYEIQIEDVSKYYVEHSHDPLTQSRNVGCNMDNSVDYAVPSHFNLGSMGGFFTYEEIMAQLDLMATTYPNLVKSKSPIGNFNTSEGRSIYWLKISDNPNMDEDEPEMLYDAVHHAREPASVSSLLYYMWYLLENYETDNQVKAIVDNSELFFVPLVNPDGYIYNQSTNPEGGGMWRKNRRDNGNGTYGVDNNRNYGVQWNTSGVSSNTNSEVYPGTAPFSEAENQAIKWLCENHNFKMAFNNHTWSNLLLYPYGYAVNTPTPDHDLYQLISGEMVSKNGFINELAADLYPASGDSDDWMYDATANKPKIYAFTPEIGGTGFWPSQAEIIPICKSTMYMNITAAQMISKYAKTKDLSPAFISTINTPVAFEVQRLGLEAGDFTVSIVPISANILSVGGAIAINGMNILETMNGSIDITLSPSISPGDQVQFSLITDNGVYTQEQVLTKTFGTMENIIVDTAEDLSLWTTTTWGVQPSDFSGNAFTDSPYTDYENLVDNQIQLANNLDLSNVLDASISFQAKWDIEQGWDYVQLEISTDNGVTWSPQCGNYTKLASNNQPAGEPLYDGQQMAWVHEQISLYDYIGQSIAIRFRLHSDQAVTGDGFYFDDFKIDVIPASVGGIDLDIVTFLQGPYNIANHLMDDGLRANGLLPLQEPYTDLGYDFISGGQETTTPEVMAVTGNTAIVDWMIVEIRDGLAPTNILQSRAALIRRDGKIVSMDGIAPLHFEGLNNQNILIALRHRNHLGIRSLNPITVSDVASFHFDNISYATFGENAQLTLDGRHMMYGGDANRDGQIGSVDRNNNWRVENALPYSYTTTKSDFNLDGVVNSTDLNQYWRPNNSKVEQLD